MPNHARKRRKHPNRNRNQKGTVSLDMVGKKGSNPYSGNKLENIRFMVAVTEADVYTFNVKGNKATGTIKIKKIS